MSELKYFTVDEANAMVPDLEARFSRVMQLRAQLRLLYKELESLGEPPTAETLARSDGGPQLASARGRFRALVEALTEELREIEECGVAVKDLDTGLCDFLGRQGDRDVWLCWQLGEKRVSFWHDLNTGFAGRQPLDVAPRAPARILH